MIIVSAREFRANLSRYLDKLEAGETITLMRNSAVIGKLVPAKANKREKQIRHKGTGVVFRQFGIYEDPQPVMDLHKQALQATGAYIDDPQLDKDLWSPSANYASLGGEFWVGELDGQVVAIGAFRLNLAEDRALNEAEIKRLRVHSDLQGRGLGKQMLQLLEKRARQHGYTSLALDTTDQQMAARGLYEGLGFAEYRRQPAENFELIYYRKAL